MATQPPTIRPLPQHRGQGIRRRGLVEHAGEGERAGHERERDQEADPAPVKEAAEVAPRRHRPPGEELRHRAPHVGFGLRRYRLRVHVDHQPGSRAARRLRCPAHDELLRRGIEVALVERRRVDLVEELAQLPHVHVYVEHGEFSGSSGSGMPPDPQQRDSTAVSDDASAQTGERMDRSTVKPARAISGKTTIRRRR
jgi:hypothetical protein